MTTTLRLKIRGLGDSQQLQVPAETSFAEFRCLVAAALGLYDRPELSAEVADCLVLRTGVPPKLLSLEPDLRLQGALCSGNLVTVSLDDNALNPPAPPPPIASAAELPASAGLLDSVQHTASDRPLDPLQYLPSAAPTLTAVVPPFIRRSQRTQDNGGEQFAALLEAEKQRLRQEQSRSGKPAKPAARLLTSSTSSLSAESTSVARNVARVSRLLRPEESQLEEPAPSALSRDGGSGSSTGGEPVRKRRKLSRPRGSAAAADSGTDDEDDLERRRDALLTGVLAAVGGESELQLQLSGLDGMSLAEAKQFKSKLREDVEKMWNWRRGSHRYAAALAGHFYIRLVARNLGGEAEGAADSAETVREKRMKAMLGNVYNGSVTASAAREQPVEPVESAQPEPQEDSSFGRMCVYFGATLSVQAAERLQAFKQEFPDRPPPSFLGSPPPVASAPQAGASPASAALLREAAFSKKARRKLLKQTSSLARRRLVVPPPAAAPAPPPALEPQLSQPELEARLQEIFGAGGHMTIERHPCFSLPLFRQFLLSTLLQAGVFQAIHPQQQGGQAVLSLSPELREHLRAYNLAESSPAIFFNMVHLFGERYLGPSRQLEAKPQQQQQQRQAEDSSDCWKQLFPQLDWSWMRARRRALSQKARQSLEQQNLQEEFLEDEE